MTQPCHEEEITDLHGDYIAILPHIISEWCSILPGRVAVKSP